MFYNIILWDCGASFAFYRVGLDSSSTPYSVRERERGEGGRERGQTHAVYCHHMCALNATRDVELVHPRLSPASAAEMVSADRQATIIGWSWHKYHFCRDKSFVINLTNVLSRQTHLLSRQK